MTITKYNLVDSKTDTVIKEYKVSQRKTARRRADKLDNEYGSYRYFVRPVIEVA